MNYCCICGKSFSSDWEDIAVLLVKEMELPVCDECADILESLNGKEHGEAVKIIEKRLVENHCSDEICDAVMNLICNDEAEVKTDKKDAETQAVPDVQKRSEQMRQQLEHQRQERHKQDRFEQERLKKEADLDLKKAAGRLFDVNMDEINPKVAEYLMETAKRKLEEEKKYRDSVLIDCGLCHKGKVTDVSESGVRYTKEGNIAEKVTPEEFELILKASGMRKTPKFYDDSSAAATFFGIIGVIVLVVGLIISILMADAARNNEFAVFMENFLTYGMYGCLAFCASELFRRLAKIQSLLTSIRDRLKDDD